MTEKDRIEEFAKGSELITGLVGAAKCVGLGESRDNPILIGQDDIPYGAWFKCNECGTVARSTFSFDCYGETGEPLICEYCAQKKMRGA